MCFTIPKYLPIEFSNIPYPHRHLWSDCVDKDTKSGKTTIAEKCKFCHIVRNKNQK